MISCDQEKICHGGQEGPNAEGVELSGSRNARDRTPCKGVFPWWWDKQLQHCLVAILECKCSEATFGQQSWAEGWFQGRAETPHTTAHGIGAGAGYITNQLVMHPTQKILRNGVIFLYKCYIYVLSESAPYSTSVKILLLIWPKKLYFLKCEITVMVLDWKPFIL